jgi:hypothetical protein
VLGCVTLVLAAASVVTEPEPSDQTRIFYNARLAMRDGAPADALKLWLLRNAVVSRVRHTGKNDEEFRSVVWAATGALGLCQDGFGTDDEGGAGLWPLALHNFLVSAMGRGEPPDPPAAWDAFDVKRQQRLVSLHDVLATDELRTVRFFRTTCTLPVGFKMPDTQDKLEAGRALKKALQRALSVVVREKFLSTAVVEARLFDLELALQDLYARKMKREGAITAAQARRLGLSEPATAELTQKWPEQSPQADFMRKALAWPASDWLSLTRERRLFLYAQARPYAKSTEAVEPLLLAIIDALIAKADGDELNDWIGYLDTKDAKAVLTHGDRGKALLQLQPESGFKERAVVALHRGVAELEAGERLEALRSFSFAMAHAEESKDPAVLSLGRRWVAYVLARYETNPEVLATVRTLVPSTEYNAVVEDLIWRAAFRADQKSFDLLAESVKHGGSLDYRIDRLRPLSLGNPGALATTLRNVVVDEPYMTLRFIRLLIEKIEIEDPDVRAANAPLLDLLRKVLDGMIDKKGKSKSQSHVAEELIGRTDAILDGLNRFDMYDTGPARKGRAISLKRETFAGNVRLAPADPLPWPFGPPIPNPPAVFLPLKLEPVEWRDTAGKLVFGWRISE